MSKNEIRDLVLSAIARIQPQLDATSVSDTTTLSDLGLDSVALIELGFLIETRLGHELSLDEWIDIERTRDELAFSVDSLVEYVSACTTSTRSDA